ncbi:gamma-glutamyltransferase [Thiosulfativibrio zosterae]|uniref:Glutathione hydrolase proenzyme n=1 Tax=Thiosulfativibrio zosterae TaxID=2675053 RepID=A0A6F8PQ74_9GAMM|nr:gamma-glutamyltransferase [Thiosulfativibrio zosterae]BBP44273.1 gamma-glutamyltranspeptidase [Thiosulfativibrio zosterae]
MKTILKIFLPLLLVFFLKDINAKQAAVAMPDAFSAKVAEQVLKSGGNAVDAAVAASFVLAVTYPEAGNLGGGGFMTLVVKQKPYFLDYREKAPKGAFRDLYLDANKQVIPHRSLVGYQASGVPGTVAGMWAAHQKFGKKPWAKLLQPAIDLAEKGFKVPRGLANTADWYQTWVANKSTDELNFESYFGDLKAGTIKKQPLLAATLQRLAKDGADEFYQGETAKMIASQMVKHQGLISLEDLKAYQPVWREPIVGHWQGRQIISAPPPSSGGIALVQLLKMKSVLKPQLDRALVKSSYSGMTDFALKTHFYAELEKRVYADRAHYLGDPDFIKVPSESLLSDDYLKSRAQNVLLDGISETEAIQPGKIESAETTHFSIIDAQGNAVANTTTLNMPFGSGVVIEGAGFLMNNEMDDFSTKPGVANIFGVVGGSANEIAPEKRMLSSMSPTIVMQGKQVEMVLGTPGGSSIITSVFQTIVNVVDEKMTAQQAVDAPRVHHQLLPKDVIYFNPSLKPEDEESLTLMGYQLKKNDYLGDIQLIVQQNGQLNGASDYRGRGVAKVFNLQ